MDTLDYDITSFSALVMAHQETLSGQKEVLDKAIRPAHISLLFVLNTFGRYINFMANTLKFSSDSKVAKNDPLIPHLIFANDCLIFIEQQVGDMTCEDNPG